MASVVITILDVQEKVNSERATGKLASLAQKRGFRAKGVDREGDQKGTGDLDQLMEDLDVANTNISSDQLAPDPNFGRDVPGPSSSSKSGRAESGQENKRGSDGEELLQEIQQTLDGTLMLRWVDSADGQLAEEYEALLQIDKWLVDVVSDESKTSHFSLLPGFYSSVCVCVCLFSASMCSCACVGVFIACVHVWVCSRVCSRVHVWVCSLSQISNRVAMNATDS